MLYSLSFILWNPVVIGEGIIQVKFKWDYSRRTQKKDRDLGRIQNEEQIEESNSTSDREYNADITTQIEKPIEAIEEAGEYNAIQLKEEQKEIKPKAAKSKSETSKP